MFSSQFYFNISFFSVSLPKMPPHISHPVIWTFSHLILKHALRKWNANREKIQIMNNRGLSVFVFAGRCSKKRVKKSTIWLFFFVASEFFIIINIHAKVGGYNNNNRWMTPVQFKKLSVTKINKVFFLKMLHVEGDKSISQTRVAVRMCMVMMGLISWKDEI